MHDDLMHQLEISLWNSKPGHHKALCPKRTNLRKKKRDRSLYITINDIERDGRRRPFEIFINTKSLEHYAWTVALTRMISAVFRRGGDVTFVAEELQAIFDPKGGRWSSGRYVPSLQAAIGEIIEGHMKRIGFVQEGAGQEAPTAIATAEVRNDGSSAVVGTSKHAPPDVATPSGAGERQRQQVPLHTDPLQREHHGKGLVVAQPRMGRKEDDHKGCPEAEVAGRREPGLRASASSGESNVRCLTGRGAAGLLGFAAHPRSPRTRGISS